jgi:hypothetical protein
MVEQEYEKLVHYLEGMIADGVALVHGGQLFDWEDTMIPDLLREIKEKREHLTNKQLEAGDLLKNIYSGQKAAVINDDGETVKMAMLDTILTYPKQALWAHFEKSEPGN